MSTNWNLTENALEFLDDAIEELGKGDVRLRHAVIHLACALEILIKTRLVRADWTLVAKRSISEPDRVKAEADFLAGTLETVPPVPGLERLVKQVGLQIPQHRFDAVRGVAGLRNRTLHFALINVSPVAVKAVLAQGLDFALWFLDQHVRPGADTTEADMISETIENISSELGTLGGVIEDRLKALAGELATYYLLVECPRCRMNAMALEGTATLDGPARCLFCLWQPVGENSAYEYVTTVRGQSYYGFVNGSDSWSLHHCLSCSQEALVEGITNEASAAPSPTPTNVTYLGCDAEAPIYWGCFACGYYGPEFDIGRCFSCGEITDTGEDGTDICSECWSIKLGAD